MTKGKQADAILIRQTELERIKESTKYIGKQQEIEEKKRLELSREKERKNAEDLKQRMKEFDKSRSKKLPFNSYQQSENEKNETLLTKAKKAMDEDLDEVKGMNTLIHYAKCATIRERQLAEAKELERIKKEDDKKMAVMMELERLKAIQFHEEREKLRMQNQRQGALVIVDQIKDREHQRQIEHELKEKEQKQMLKQIQELQQDEVKHQAEKLRKAKELMETVQEANKRAMDVKHKKSFEEKELDKKIVEYNKQKDKREEEYQAELKRIHDEKEKDVQRLRERQQRAINKQAEIDELKAKRAFEENERRTREKERQECEEKVSYHYNE